MLNPLTPHINLSTQHSVPTFFTWDFKFYCLLLEKIAYLIDFSFRFNEMKFYSVIMNWLIWGKMFSYFYNKFSPVNHMHYLKCVVNNSLLTLLWMLQKVCGTVDPCFITTHSVHKEGDFQI